MKLPGDLATDRILQPGRLEELQELVSRARETGRSLLPVGGGTDLHVGNRPRRLDDAVSTARLAGVIGAYSPADLVLTVGAGTPLADVQEFLAGFDQRLPLEAPPGATAGGVVAAATAGKRRLSAGTPRDWLVGIQAVLGTGSTIRGGGKVVKNVTGYDLPKLFCGSRGSLGILCELSFKVAPLPETVAEGRLACESFEAAERIRRAAVDAGAAWIDLVIDGEMALEVGFEGYAEDVAAQVARVPAEWRHYPGSGWLGEKGAPTFGDAFVMRLGVLPDRLVPLLRDRRILRAHAHLGSGLARIAVSDAGELPAWRQAVAHAGGWVVVERGPADQDVFGEARPEWEIGRRLKQVFDPDGIMAPGRGPGRM